MTTPPPLDDSHTRANVCWDIHPRGVWMFPVNCCWCLDAYWHVLLVFGCWYILQVPGWQKNTEIDTKNENRDTRRYTLCSTSIDSWHFFFGPDQDELAYCSQDGTQDNFSESRLRAVQFYNDPTNDSLAPCGISWCNVTHLGKAVRAL